MGYKLDNVSTFGRTRGTDDNRLIKQEISQWEGDRTGDFSSQRGRGGLPEGHIGVYSVRSEAVWEAGVLRTKARALALLSNTMKSHWRLRTKESPRFLLHF
jgi:hypothetical protein